MFFIRNHFKYDSYCMNANTLSLAPVRRSSQMEDAAYQSVVEAKVNSLTAQVGFHKA